MCNNVFTTKVHKMKPLETLISTAFGKNVLF